MKVSLTDSLAEEVRGHEGTAERRRRAEKGGKHSGAVLGSGKTDAEPSICLAEM